MKKIILSFFGIVLSMLVLASTTPEKRQLPEERLNAKLIQIPIGNSGKYISLYKLSTLGRTELEAITGKKMTMGERLAFNKTKKRLAKGIEADGTIKDKKILKAFGRDDKDRSRGFHFGGFALGFILGIIGVVLAYVIDDTDEKKNRVKWSWIGFGIRTILVIGLYVILFATVWSF
jgi:hypothetical protein